MSNYKGKAKDSFRTKLNLFLYHFVSSGAEVPFDLEAFNKFQCAPGIIHEYTTEYWQGYYHEQIRGRTIKDIYKEIDQVKFDNAHLISEWEKYYTLNVFDSTFPLADFQQLALQQKCYYCGITQNEINELASAGRIYKKKDRGWNLEIDRLDSNREYSADNCVMCCYWCNNAKTDEFTPAEFKEIAGAIRKVWDQRLRGDRFIDGGEGLMIIKKHAD